LASGRTLIFALSEMRAAKVWTWLECGLQGLMCGERGPYCSSLGRWWGPSRGGDLGHRGSYSRKKLMQFSWELASFHKRAACPAPVALASCLSLWSLSCSCCHHDTIYHRSSPEPSWCCRHPSSLQNCKVNKPLVFTEYPAIVFSL
jgi:hypothetical protein